MYVDGGALNARTGDFGISAGWGYASVGGMIRGQVRCCEQLGRTAHRMLHFTQQLNNLVATRENWWEASAVPQR
jgi:hypothetical protein